MAFRNPVTSLPFSALTGQVQPGQIAPGAVGSDQLVDGAVIVDKIAANAVTTSAIAAGAVAAGKIAANAVGGPQIAAGAVTAAKIAADTITASQIAAGAVTAAELAANAVTATAIMAGAVTAGKVAADAVTANTIAAGALDGKTITGALIRTAAAGKRWEMSSSGFQRITGYSGAPDETTPGSVEVDYFDGQAWVGLNSPRLTGKGAPWLRLLGGNDVDPGGAVVLAGANSGQLGPYQWDGSGATVGWLNAKVNIPDGVKLGPAANDPAMVANGTTAAFLNGATAAGVKVGSLLIDNSYAGSAPANGLSVKGQTVLKDLVTSDGIFNNTATFAANVGIASAPQGRLYRLTSSRRYKVEITDQPIPDEAVLDLRPRSYTDKREFEANGSSSAGLPRHLGLIAEEVAQIPGLAQLLVTYRDDGKPDAVSYDRLAVALIPVIQRLAARVAALEGATP